LYSGFQFQQFWEGRARDLEEQVATVMSSPQEMNSNYTTASKYLSIQKEYKNLFQQSFPTTKDSIITLATISQSIAAFVRTLNPRNSPFDKYMQGDKNALNESEQHGFNLFMGKAQCATCHFAPLFNGLVPPLYNLSELEILGTPKTDNFAKPESDTDRGRYNIFPIAFYEKAFKTPTVRNVSATAPYMHNGSFRSLDKVVEFYNKGGGKGLGLDVKNQTLSADSLHLTNTEIKDIVSFMQSLEDKILF
jgi:cytochrome c peroxidase